jgi:aryl-alcohol dehydrogenase-like predicted oxidoreductase
MRYRKLGRTGLMVSEIGYGLWGLGGWTGGDDSVSYEALEKAVALGVNFFDSAWAYGDGKSDRTLGRLLTAHPGDTLIAASKVPPRNLKWPADPHDSYLDVFPEEHVREFADRIRRALGRDCIDLLQLHVWDDSWTENAALADTVEALKREGIIRWFGISLNRWEPWNGLKAVHSGLVDAVQVIYNVFDQAPEDRLFPACNQHDVGVIARVPLDEGSLGGRLTLHSRFPSDDWRARYFGPENLGPTVERVERLRAELPDTLPLPEAALRFILGSSDVDTTIVGMRKVRHVVQNADASTQGALPPELMARLRRHRWDRRIEPWSD